LGNVAAGSPILAQECVEEYLSFQPDGGGEDCFALRVRGESMLHAGILPDDLVVVKPTSEARNGQIVVALFEDEATVKTFRRESDGHVWLLPENPDYEPIDGQHCQIIGKVVSVIRRY
jgi:repressor LexA